MESEGKHKEEEGGGGEKAKKEEEGEYCSTPTGSGNRIPEIKNCPPAPRKRRRSPSSSSSSSTLTRRSSFTDHELHFFEETRLQEFVVPILLMK
ncbi:cyclin-dependent protein kinase inhibitor SMR2-like isoform X2 [Neltuma alba]|uniref:cyclin-dependent protein kinase inhibitor SMR2-like isoform X2 n=1 Tax=Neltuma alba TaxID=207710 RepID=UPI0010A51E65|nr:cyclin-dependent protein kinase inhibitor SMR2-like isoform X2 [Prosopis alba]